MLSGAAVRIWASTAAGVEPGERSVTTSRPGGVLMTPSWVKSAIGS